MASVAQPLNNDDIDTPHDNHEEDTKRHYETIMGEVHSDTSWGRCTDTL